MLILLTLLSCARLDGDACACPMPAHGAVDPDGDCMCLPMLPATLDPEATTTFDASPSKPPNWKAIDQALASGPVRVVFAPEVYDERLEVQRSDRSENRLILDGGSGNKRATMPGITTGYDKNRVDYTTVRGFEVTGSRDKGVYWNAGDYILIEDVVVHDNKGSPAINLQYSNRTSMPSAEFVVRNSHVYNQSGECIYIGGSEGEDQDSHLRVVLENNLVHDCLNPLDSKHDGINVKDRIGEVLVHRNVVFETDWGIEVASPGLYSNNLVFDPVRNGFQVSDAFARLDGLVFVDNVVLGAPDEGFYLSAENHAAGELTIERATVIGAAGAFQLNGAFPIDPVLMDIAVLESGVGFDGWGESSATLEGCATANNEVDDDRTLNGLAKECSKAPKAGNWSKPAGKDGVFFTSDDPWLLDGVGARLPEPTATAR